MRHCTHPGDVIIVCGVVFLKHEVMENLSMRQNYFGPKNHQVHLRAASNTW